MILEILEEDLRELYDRLDNLEGCEDNPVYAREIKRIRAEIDSVSLDIMECLYG